MRTHTSNQRGNARAAHFACRRRTVKPTSIELRASRRRGSLAASVPQASSRLARRLLLPLASVVTMSETTTPGPSVASTASTKAATFPPKVGGVITVRSKASRRPARAPLEKIRYETRRHDMAR